MSTVESIVADRYSAAASAPEAALCCPVDYDPQYLRQIPDEIIEKDYGCGDPSRHVKEGETVLDLGSGGGKICYIASQIVGARGRVIGVDMNDEMLSLARGYQDEMASRLGYGNVSFLKGRIQDLTLDRDRLDVWLQEHPVLDETSLRRFEEHVAGERQHHPLVDSDSIDVVLSNCVLNLVDDAQKVQLFSEIFRVLRRGGRAAISDIVADEPVPMHLKQDDTLWSGCISGAMEETAFVEAFVDTGFYGVEIAKRDPEPWQTVDGIEFRSVTVVAYKGKEGECWDHNEALIYKGPFGRVTDDDGHTFVRGERAAVCRKTYEIYSKEPYAAQFERVEPLARVDDPEPFSCTGEMPRRHPRQSKGRDYDLTTQAGECGEPGCC